MKLKLHDAWTRRLKLLDDGNKIRAEGDKLWAECNKLIAEGGRITAEIDKLRAECNNRWAEGDKLRAEGDKLWAEAIIDAYGNVTLKWSWRTEHGECELENGDRYDVDQSELELEND